MIKANLVVFVDDTSSFWWEKSYLSKAYKIISTFTQDIMLNEKYKQYFLFLHTPYAFTKFKYTRAKTEQKTENKIERKVFQL